MVPKQSITVLGNPSGTVLGCLNSSGAWTPRIAVTGGAWAHAPPEKSGSVRGAVMLPPLFDLFTCKSKKTHSKGSRF